MTIDFRKKECSKVAVLVDPDKATTEGLEALMRAAQDASVDFFFVGGSVLLGDRFHKTIAQLKTQQHIPVVIFPGNNLQVDAAADGLLFLSLLSGRNAEFLIGQQVAAAGAVRAAGLQTIATAYLLIDGGRSSTTAYITQTQPIPADRADVAVATALAAEMLGFRAIYLEAGSGALQSVSAEMVRRVREQTAVPLLVGGGIRDGKTAAALCAAGADTIVIGNVLERQPELLAELCAVVRGQG